MKTLFLKVFTASLALLLITGCTGKETEPEEIDEVVETPSSVNEDKQDDNKVNEENDEVVNEDDENAVEDEQEVVDNEGNEEEVEASGLALYKPEQATIRSYTENGELVYTEEVIAVNDQFVQILLTLGSSKTTEIYKWDEDEIALVFQQRDLENDKTDMLDNFKPNIPEELIVGENATWKLLGEHEEISIGNQTYKDVIKVTKTTEEVVGEKTNYTRYYAKGLGRIKEEIEQTGEAGYNASMELTKVEGGSNE